MELGGLKVGVNVDIQRTDGRVHSAVISGVSANYHSVTVEWFERGETKGKEIETEAILSMNPALATPAIVKPPLPPPVKEPPHPAPSRAKANRDTDDERPSSKEETEDDEITDASQEEEYSNNRNGKAGKPLRSNIPGAKGRVKKSNKSTRASSVASTVKKEKETPRNAPVVAVAAGGKPRRSFIIPPSSQPPKVENGFGEPVNDFKKPQPVANNKLTKEQEARRKSSCVKEVERIKQRRDQRRAAQVAIKETNEEEYDTSDPNWEFLAMIRDFRSTLDYRPLTATDAIVDHQICVCIRKRPLSKKELDRKEADVVTVPSKDNLFVHEPKSKVDLTKYLENQSFRFDYTFDDNTNNEMVYKYTAKPLVDGIFEGGMATCFAYGQTGSGKTHTMGGDFSQKGQQDCSKGIYAFSARDVFRLLHTKYKKHDFVVSCSFFEIYSGKVFDLMNNKNKLRVLEDHKQQVVVVGLKEEHVECVDDVLRLIQGGNNVRNAKKLHGKFSLIDLAGNERGADTNSADRLTRMEGAEINKSLLALKECIRALGRKGAHLPFRASKLTQVLRDSFIGEKAKTCMIAMISPGLNCCEHTLNTLRYADRVKELGPGGPNEERPSAVIPPNNYNIASMSPQNSDLVMLKTSNQEEVSDELLNFHEVINHMQDMEEEVIDEHKTAIELSQRWLQEDRKLLKKTDEVDYDVEGYALQLEELLNKKIQAYMSLREKVIKFREEMQAEETLNRSIISKHQGKK